MGHGEMEKDQQLTHALEGLMSFSRDHSVNVKHIYILRNVNKFDASKSMFKLN